MSQFILLGLWDEGKKLEIVIFGVKETWECKPVQDTAE